MRTLLAALAALCILAPPARGQLFEIEARGGVSVGSHSSTVAGLEALPRPSLDLLVKRDLWKYTLLVSGSYSSFGCENGFCKGANTVEIRHITGVVGMETGYRLAWLRGGAGFGLTEIRGTSEVGPSLFIATGVRLDLWRFAVLPGVSYRWMHSGKETLTMSGDIGISYRVGSSR